MGMLRRRECEMTGFSFYYPPGFFVVCVVVILFNSSFRLFEFRLCGCFFLLLAKGVRVYLSRVHT